MRYTDESKDFDYNNVINVLLDDFGNNLGPFPVADSIEDSIDSSELTGNVVVDWDVSDATNLYAGIRRGIKAAGFNTGLGAGTQFDEEVLTSYEIGVKSDLGAATRVSASLFYYCLLYTSPSPRDLSTSRMPSSA